MKSMLDFLQEPDDVSPQQSGPVGYSMLDAFKELDEQTASPAAAVQPTPVALSDESDPQLDAAALPGTPSYDFGDELDAGMIQPIAADPQPVAPPPSVFNQPPDPRQQIIDVAMEQPGPTQLKADLGIDLEGNPRFTRDMGTAFRFGQLNTRANTQGFAADIEETLRDTAMSQWMQKTQNFLRQPLINPVRKFFGAEPLPEDANLRESRAFAERARNSSERLMKQAEALGYRPLTTDKIKNFGDFLDWAQTSLAASGEPMIVAIASGGWMSPLLLGGEFNANLKEIEGLSQADRVALAASGGTVAAVLENLGLGILIKGLPDELIGKLGGQYFVNWVNKNYGTRVASAVATSMATEGITETGQDSIGIGLEAIAGKEFKEGEIKSRLRESFLTGAAVGTQVSAATSAGKETASAIANRFPKDQEASEFDSLLAQKIVRDMLNPNSAEFGFVDPEAESNFFSDIEFQAQTQAAATNVNEKTTEQLTRLRTRAEQATRLAQETDRRLAAAEGRPVDLDATRNDELRADAENYATEQREKARTLTAQARELEEFYATADGQAYAAEILALQKIAEDEGLNIDIAARLNTIPTESIQDALVFARIQLQQAQTTKEAREGRAPSTPNTPATDVSQILKPLEGRQTRAAQAGTISTEETQRALDVLNRLNKQLNDMGFEVGQALNPSNSTQEARDLKSQIVNLAGVYHELRSQRYARDNGHENFKPEKLAEVEKEFVEAFGGAAPQPAPEPVTQPVTQPAPQPVTQPVTQPAPEPVAQPEPEQENPQAPTEEALALPITFLKERGQKGQKTIRTPDGDIQIKVRPVLVDQSELKSATGDLQPRDRSLRESQVEVQRRAANLAPDMLLNSPTSESGAPIIARDGTVISGNGRVMSIREAYKQFPEKAEAYKQALKEYGQTEQNFLEPVLVFMIDQDMTRQELVQFADKSNRSTIATMSDTETSQRDARAMGVEVINLYKGGDFTREANQPFVRQFMRLVVTPAEQNEMTRNGMLTRKGVQRMQSAILAAAYTDTQTLSLMLDSAENNIKGIGNAMLEAAPSFVQLKADIDAGLISPEYDITAFVTEAAQIVSQARRTSTKIIDVLNQTSELASISPEAEALVKIMYNEDLTRAKSQKFITDVLKFYTEEALKKQDRDAGFFTDNTTPQDVLEAARSKADGTQGQGSLLPETGISDRNQTGRKQTQRQRGPGRGEGLRDVDTADTQETGQAQIDGQISTEEAGQAAAEADTRVVEVSKIDNQRTAKPGTRVSKIKERNKTALMFTAFADAGLNPNEATSLPIERQYRILSTLVQDRFGFKSITKTENANTKEAVDQLLTGYHNLSAMANVLGLPYKAIGLDGTLSFIMAKEIGAYGVYYPGQRAIAVPRRVNSFAHEWFHALDHYVYEKFGQNAGKFPLASDVSRKEGKDAFKDDAPVGVVESYLALSRAMFKDKATEAQQLAKIEQDMAKMEANAGKRGKDVYASKSYKALVEQRKRILEGTGRSPAIKKTNFRTSAEFFAQMAGSDASYWASPREMFARTGEAFITNKMALDALNADFLGGTQEGYMMTLEQLGVTEAELTDPANAAIAMDSRLALTFPKDAERMEIFGAMQNLMYAIAAETALGEGQVGKMPGDNFTFDVRRMHDVTEPESKGIIQDQIKAFRDRKKFMERMAQRASEYDKYEKGRIPVLNARRRKTIEDGFTAPLFYQKQGVLKALIKRYPKSKRLKLLMQLLSTHTGGSLQSMAEGDNLTNAQMRQVRIFSDRLKNVSVRHDIPGFTKEEIDLLRDILIGQDTLGSAPDKVTKAAGEIRLIYNTLYEYLRNSGLDIGYAPSGYVQRLLDHVEINTDPQGFSKAAKDVYGVVFENEVGKLDTDSIEQMDRLIEFIREAKLGIVQMDQWRNFIRSDEFKQIQDLRREARNENTTDARKDEIEAEIEDVFAGMKDIYEQFYNDMLDIYSEIKGANWRTSIQESHVGDPVANGGPSQDFTKKRALPPEADKILEKYYVSDPIENLTTYIMGAVRKAEYNKRFGRQRIPKGENPNNKYTDYLHYTLAKLASQDRLLQSELAMLESAINNMLGRNIENYAPNNPQKVANRLTALLSMTLLIRAPIASIAEPFTVALASNSVKKGMNAWGMTLMEFPGLRKMTKEGIRQRQQFARIMGVIDDPEVGDIIANRIGGDFAGEQNLNKLLSSFFHKIKLSGMTNAQRRSAAKIGFQYITEMAYEYKKPITPKAKEQAKRVLNDLGVADSRMEQFVDYVLSFNDVKRKNRLRDFAIGADARGKAKIDGKLELPTAEDVMDDSGEFNDMGLQLAVSVMRFTDQSIQDPRTQDRPMYAEHPIGRLVYGIMSFVYSFQDKVLKAMVRRTAREYDISRTTGQGKASAAGSAALYATSTVAGPLLSLFTAHFLVSTAREFLLNQERWDREWDESDEDELKFFTNYLLPLALSRAGATGAFDPIVQAITGLKYQRDLSNGLLGTGGYIAQNMQDIASFWINNSPNTLYSEYRALRGAWNLSVAPAVSLAIANLPLTPATALAATGIGQYATSSTVRNKAINAFLEGVYGEKYVRGGKGRTKSSFPDIF